jgi:hypothetical protein
VSREISNTIVLGQEWTSAQSKAGALEAEHKPLGIRLMEGEQKKKIREPASRAGKLKWLH